MNMKFLSAAAFATAALVAGPAVASTIVFDDFTVVQSVQDEPSIIPDVPASSTVSLGGGLERTLTAENINPGNDPVGATELASGGGLLSFSNSSGATGTGTVAYSGVGDIQLDTLSRSFFFFEIAPDGFDGIANFIVTATDTSMNVSTFTEVLLPGFDPFLFFSEFTGSADFNDLATLSFMIDSENVPGFGPQARLDGDLLSIQIGSVPLPASGILLIGALGGVAAMRRRKAKKAA